MYSPYFAVEKYRSAPDGCRVAQLQRHGARYPTTSASERIKVALAKLISAEHYTDPSLHFLKTYTYSLETDKLVPFGAS
ncbi:hypothetical protein H0H92_007571, partial [Tricholoma furcatifolium]